MPKHGTPGWFLFLWESIGAQLGQGGCSSLLGASNQGSGLFSWMFQPALPLSSSLLLQSLPAGLSWVACFQSTAAVTCLVPSTKRAVTCSRHCPGPCPPVPGAMQTPQHAGLSSVRIFCHPGGNGAEPPPPSPALSPAEPGGLPAAAHRLLFVTGQGHPRQPQPLALLEGRAPVCAELSEGDKKQLGGYFKQNVSYICKSVKNKCQDKSSVSL